MFVEDLKSLFADFGVTATSGAESAQVIFDTPDQAVLGDMQLSTDYAITFAASDLPSLKHGSAITVNGIAHTVRAITLLDDGLLKRASLKR